VDTTRGSTKLKLTFRGVAIDATLERTTYDPYNVPKPVGAVSYIISANGNGVDISGIYWTTKTEKDVFPDSQQLLTYFDTLLTASTLTPAKWVTGRKPGEPNRDAQLWTAVQRWAAKILNITKEPARVASTVLTEAKPGQDRKPVVAPSVKTQFISPEPIPDTPSTKPRNLGLF